MAKNYQTKTFITQSKILFFSTGILLIFLSWIIFSSIKDNDVFPKVDKIFNALINLLKDKDLYIALGMSILRVIIVILSSLICSFIISFLYVIKKSSYYLFKPLILLLRATPLAIISVYLWISLSSDIAPYFITFLMVLPISIEGFITAIDQINNDMLDAAKLEQGSTLYKFFTIHIPSIFPYIIMTLLQTFGMGVKVMLMGEYMCQSNDSLGNLIYAYKANIEFDYLLALMIIIVLIVFLIEMLIRKTSKKLV